MRPKLHLTKEIKAVDPEDGIRKEVYLRVTQDYAEDILKTEFKKVRSLSKQGKAVEFTLVRYYPYKSKNSSPDFINEDRDGVEDAPILVFGKQRKFRPFRKALGPKPYMRGHCMVVPPFRENNQMDGGVGEENAEPFGDGMTFFERPKGRHLALVVESQKGSMPDRVIREALTPLKNQLDTKRFHIYDELPISLQDGEE